jgi:TrmH family RNA methyltransferase
MEYISSIHNASIKKIRALKKRASREKLGLAFIEGKRLVSDAVAAGGLVRELYVAERFYRSGAYGDLEGDARRAGLVPVMVADPVFDLIADTGSPQGILAVIGFLAYSPDDLLGRGTGGSRVLVMDGIGDPGNAGTMIRTAEAAGFTGVAMSEGCVDLYSPKTLRATMGSALRVPIATGVRLEGWLPALRRRGITVFAASPDVGKSCFGRGFASNDVALVVGSEAAGVSEQIRRLCDCEICVPMIGGPESLNVAVAAGIIMYEALRRRLFRDGAATDAGMLR